MDGEVWKAVEGFPGYEVSTFGRVRSYHQRNGYFIKWKIGTTPTLLKLRTRSGYKYVKLMKGDKTFKLKSVHVLVLETFVGPRPKGMVACHHPDNDKSNNRLDNLRWDTRQSNSDDRYEAGTMLFGEKPVSVAPVGVSTAEGAVEQDQHSSEDQRLQNGHRRVPSSSLEHCTGA